MQSQIIFYYNNFEVLIKMPTCSECKFYKKIDETKGDCFGVEVPANADVNMCPQKAFQPR